MLHLIFQSPVETAVLERITSEDTAVFFANAALRLLKNGSTDTPLLTRQLSHTRFCVLSDDIVVRGIAPDRLIQGIEVIDYSELVDLTIRNRIIQSWT